ncbi:hypothetical protein SS50377_20619 [Spironucleus salmonicida]|uniref:Uncharacterized protein n=1 Tax=Spironucleus salmonicida TaxID=348837 RepID=V6LQ99_9EUKA|nr:hypothetical protein SS50377_20619 [Spironucleus salmonicida]|eukprot:EST45886.1 Hypothetical protein SS50377_14177 [Spironucleus salmonicida]
MNFIYTLYLEETILTTNIRVNPTKQYFELSQFSFCRLGVRHAGRGEPQEAADAAPHQRGGAARVK